MAAFLCGHKYSELPKVFEPEEGLAKLHLSQPEFSNLFDLVKNIVKGKGLFSTQTLKTAVRQYCGDMTFMEIYDMNNWILNITVTDRVR